jgi:hypothetical protein
VGFDRLFSFKSSVTAELDIESARNLTSVATAAENIMRARLYRAVFHRLLGTEPSEADMPFPIAPDDEVMGFIRP